MKFSRPVQEWAPVVRHVVVVGALVLMVAYVLLYAVHGFICRFESEWDDAEDARRAAWGMLATWRAPA